MSNCCAMCFIHPYQTVMPAKVLHGIEHGVEKIVPTKRNLFPVNPPVTYPGVGGTIPREGVI